MRISFQESATPRQFAPKMSTPLLGDGSDYTGIVNRHLFGDDDDLPNFGLTRINSATPSRTPDGGR